MVLSCSFCGKERTAVRLLISGPTVQICDGCVELCVDIAGSDDPADPKSIAAPVETVEQKTDTGWSIWSFNKSPKDAEDTLATLRRCNPTKVYRTARYVRISTGSES